MCGGVEVGGQEVNHTGPVAGLFGDSDYQLEKLVLHQYSVTFL